MLMNIWGTLASLSIIVSYLPQLKQTYTTKNVEGQNIYFWGLLTFSVAYFFVNAIVVGAGIVTILAQLFNLLGAGSMLIMVYKYQSKNNEDLKLIEDDGYFYKTQCNKCGKVDRFCSTISKPEHTCEKRGINEELKLGVFLNRLVDTTVILFEGKYDREHLLGEYKCKDVPPKFYYYVIKLVLVSNTGEVVLIINDEN